MMTVFVQVVVMLLKSFSCFCNLQKAFTCTELLFALLHHAEFQRKVLYFTRGVLHDAQDAEKLPLTNLTLFAARSDYESYDCFEP